MLEELVKDQLIESRNAIKKLELNNEELIINKVKQPAAVHER